jgi:hypothetical protein
MEIRTIQPFLHYFESVRERTMRVAYCIPPDQLDWTYAPVECTSGDLLRHLAVSERFMWAETLRATRAATPRKARNWPMDVKM